MMVLQMSFWLYRKIVDKKKKSVRWELPDSRDLEENSDPKVRFLQPIVRSTLSSRRPIDRGSHHHRIPTSASNVGLKEKVTQKWEQEVDEDRRALEHLWNEIVQTPRHYTPQEAQVAQTVRVRQMALLLLTVVGCMARYARRHHWQKLQQLAAEVPTAAYP